MPFPSHAIALLLAASWMVLPSATSAEEQVAEQLDEEEQATVHFQQGRVLSARGEHQAAIEEYLAAYRLQAVPALLLHVARSYGLLHRPAEAVRYYVEFLAKARFADPERPAVEALLPKLAQEAHVDLEKLVRPRANTRRGGSRRRPQLIHTPVDKGRLKHPITVSAELPAQLKADEVVLYVRTGGDVTFHPRVMAQQGEIYVAEIPAQLVTSTALHYYIQAFRQGARGEAAGAVAEAGSPSAPYVIVIEDARAAQAEAARRDALRSPYRPWLWIGGSLAVALLGGSLATALLARDRESAMERWVSERTCVAGCPTGPRLPFDIKAQAWESEGRTFARTSQALLGVGLVAVAVTAYLWIRERTHLREARARFQVRPKERESLAPWAGRAGGGLFDQLHF